MGKCKDLRSGRTQVIERYGMSKYEKNILKEELANYIHEAWSGWMKYMFSKCEYNCGEYVIPKWAVKRWTRQSDTKYSLLPETEKESDRGEADRMIEIFKNGQE